MNQITVDATHNQATSAQAEQRHENESTCKNSGDCASNDGADVILCLGGAFNPVHTRHVMALDVGKRWLEENFNYKVIAGRMAVAPDGYVLSKTKRTNQKCMKAEHRVQLCAHACEDLSDWIQPSPPCGSALECGKRVKDEFKKINKTRNLKIAVIVGADRAVNKRGKAKWGRECGHITICIGRKGETTRVMELFEKDKTDGKVENTEFHIVPTELENVSSTAVRSVLSKINGDTPQDEKIEIIQSLVDDGLINKSCAEYIIRNEHDLYLT